MKIITIYASGGGNTEYICEIVHKHLTEQDIDNPLHRVEGVGENIFNESDVFILATSTWEHGEINPFFNQMLAKMKKMSLSGKKAFFIGLGDARYEPVFFCRGIDILADVFVSSGGEKLGSILKIDGDPYKNSNEIVDKWVQENILVV